MMNNGAGGWMMGGMWLPSILFWMLIMLGLIWPWWLRLPLPALQLRARPVTGAWGTFVLGVPFSVAICPFCTPALVVLLGVAAGIGSPVFGVALLLAFALGRAIPILLGALAVGWLESLSGLSKFQWVFEVIGGISIFQSGNESERMFMNLSI